MIAESSGLDRGVNPLAGDWGTPESVKSPGDEMVRCENNGIVSLAAGLSEPPINNPSGLVAFSIDSRVVRRGNAAKESTGSEGGSASAVCPFHADDVYTDDADGEVGVGVGDALARR